MRIRILFWVVRTLYPKTKQAFVITAFPYQGGIGFKSLYYRIPNNPCGMRDVLNATHSAIKSVSGASEAGAFKP